MAHLDDRELQLPENDCGALRRQLPVFVQKQTANGLRLRVVEVVAKFLVELLDGHTALHSVAAIGELFELGFFHHLVGRTPNVAENTFQQVLHADQPGDATVLVHRQGKGLLALAKGVEQLDGRLGLRHEIGLSQQL